MVSLVTPCKTSALLQCTDQYSSSARCPKICKINRVHISKDGSRDIPTCKDRNELKIKIYDFFFFSDLSIIQTA